MPVRGTVVANCPSEPTFSMCNGHLPVHLQPLYAVPRILLTSPAKVVPSFTIPRYGGFFCLLEESASDWQRKASPPTVSSLEGESKGYHGTSKSNES